MTDWTDGMIAGAVLLSAFILCMLTLFFWQIATTCVINVNPNDVKSKPPKKHGHIVRRSTPLRSTQHFV